MPSMDDNAGRTIMPALSEAEGDSRGTAALLLAHALFCCSRRRRATTSLISS